MDTTKTTPLKFKGFEADWAISEVTGFPRLKYDRNRPFTKEIAYRNHFIPSATVEIPKAYIIKKGWAKVIDLMELNKINYGTLKKDTVISIESYRIDGYQTTQNPYEGHYPHYNTKVLKTIKKIQFSQGDYIIPTNQPGIRYILETLEPEATDSFFNWNFFDTVLQQKEGFSPYVFEDVALELLNNNEQLKDTFLLKKTTDKEFASNWYAQLDWLYKQSQHYEPAHLQYPVYRILKNSSIDIGEIAN